MKIKDKVTLKGTVKRREFEILKKGKRADKKSQLNDQKI